MKYVVTGGTGFIGRHLLAELVKQPVEIHVLVRRPSRERLEALASRLDGEGKILPLQGDITKPNLGVAEKDLASLQGAEIFHLAAIYDLEAPEEANQLANVVGTQNMVQFANRIKAARVHHVSSYVVAGWRWKGDFTEEMFDEGQALDHPYPRTKFEAEKIVRQELQTPFRIYRPGMVVGSSKTGEADRIDGPYFGFKLIQRLGDALPSWFPLIGLEGRPLYLVPVDFVAAAMAHVARMPGLDGKTFHLLDPESPGLGDTINEFCRVARAPQFTLRVDRRAFNLIPEDMAKGAASLPVLQALKRQLLEGVRIPEEAIQYVMLSRAHFPATNTQAALQGSGISCPPLYDYSWRIWDYWNRHLDPEALTPRNLQAALADKVVLITGASSGIGRATAQLVARQGARVMLVSRTKEKLDELASEIAKEGGKAFVYSTDLADMDACQRMLEKVIKDHDRVDILINNAGRSIRRSVLYELDRFHDFQRTMQLNYFGAVKLILGVLPGMRERQSGHIINISSIGAQSFPPRFGAYVASKSAIAAFGRSIGPELADDGIAVTNIFMPLVRTPMIEPTSMYKNFPTISPHEAGEMVLSAILTRKPEVSTRLGKLGEAVNTLAPGFLDFVMTGAYHAFPESTPDGEKKEEPGKEKKEPADEMSAEASMLAYLMKGVHF